MPTNLVIVESPAKAKTIQNFLGKEFLVMSSFGHIRDLKDKEFSVDSVHNFQPTYEVLPDKKKVVTELKKAAKQAELVWLASDEDREGEAIAWHLADELHLNDANTRRIVFHEITKQAILQSIETPRKIDMNLVDAQQARRVLDRIVGFELSPVLWRKVKPSLSAGRVQSVTVRLIVEREREIQAFVAEASYRVTALFTAKDEQGETATVKAELKNRFSTYDEADAFLQICKEATFPIEHIETTPAKRSPAAPFTTSTLQQEAARKLGFPVALTMRIAQQLYESGKITYMRTDSVNLSDLALNTAKKEIEATAGAQYYKRRKYQTKTKGAQEAHEAIRPTYLNQPQISGTPQEKRLYDIIYKRTIASQMADALLEKTTVTIGVSGSSEKFVAIGEVIKFDGFLRVYAESSDEEPEDADTNRLPVLTEQQLLTRKEITAQERFAQHPPRYTEASLVRKLEELGIGRPSTYAPTISTIQNRNYVEKKEIVKATPQVHILTLKGNTITPAVKAEKEVIEKGKLSPTDIGIVVNDFLIEHFPSIMSYDFTAKVEEEFDDIAAGKTGWTMQIDYFYMQFHPHVEMAMQAGKKAGERQLGTDPLSGKPVFAKIGRYGALAQIGTADDEEKPRFASLQAGQSIETITLEEALNLFKLPMSLGEYENEPLTVAVGRFGPYIKHGKVFVSLPKGENPLEVTETRAIELLLNKREADKNRLIKSFDEDNIKILNGRFGAYIAADNSNYKIPKTMEPGALSLDDCKRIIAEEKAKGTAKKKPFKKKKA
ncbi:MAG: type I DNA topoisomerase [Prevotellaceae bacterium]|jgi:DNA topoisomerase-1|nr:type I DNA topoisomerase [Prevotellaceae bacterium]